ncbi:DMT family transporter [bacterium]|nr:DMT family transporter [bacterium]
MTGLYKLPAYKNQSKLATTFWMMAFIFLFALLVFNKLAFDVNKEILFFGALWGTGFATLTALQIYLLKHLNINTLFPISTTMSMVFSITFGLLVFAEKISVFQGLGIVIAVLAVYLFLFEKKKIKYSPNLLKFGLAMIVLSVFCKIIQKIAVDTVPDIKVLIIYQFLFASLFLLIVILIYHRQSWTKKLFSTSSKFGLLIAIPAFLGNWAIMSALSKGPFTLIYSIHSLYIFGGSIIGYLFFKEKLSKKKIALLSLAILAIIFIRLG